MMNEEMPRIDRPYLLVCPIPHYLHADGSIWLDRLWHHDLVQHLTYLRDLTLLSTRLPWFAGGDLVRLKPPDCARFRVVPIPALDTFLRMLCRLPEITLTLWNAIGRAEIVHSGIAGWPIPIGWVANPIALLRRKKLLIIVESAFWRVPEGQHPGVKARIRNSVTELLGRFFVNRADLLVFTQPSYRASLLTSGKGKAYVIPATWINDEDILSPQVANQIWDQKLQGSAVRILFAGKLVDQKGISVLLAAVRKLDKERVSLRVDVIGGGPRHAECTATAQSLMSVKMSVIPPIPYGSGFFELLRRYHAVVVPSLSDEQPRLVFDAFSQAVPVLASRTGGLAPYVVEGETGHLFESGNVDALVEVMRVTARDISGLRSRGIEGLSVARRFTHREMHRARWRILVECFGTS